MNIPVLIPVYRPGAGLPVLARTLLHSGFDDVIVVDDGSGPAYTGVFDKLRAIPGCHVLTRAANCGKAAR